VAVSCALAAGVACSKDKPTENLAPAASALEAPKPAAANTKPFAVETASSAVHFLMEAPIEKIHGEAPGAVQGELHLDLADIANSSGLVKVDLDKLVLYHQKRADEKQQYGERDKSDKQNEHARAWLEIGPESKNREQNRWAEFQIDKVENASVTDITKLTGPARPAVVTVSGDFRLHGRKNRKSVKVELTFNYAGDALESVTVKSVEPLEVDLNEYDVRPRDAVGSLLAKGLEALAPKVAKAAPIMIELTAKPK
jgi:hypothetical protein